VKGIVGEWRVARRRALPYENNAHSYRLTVAKLAQLKINIASFSDRVGYRTEIPLLAFVAQRRSVLEFGSVLRESYER
jgi:hypothetical protein